MAAHDWDAMAGCLADDVERVGPFGDTYRGRDEYVRFISDLMPTLPGYAMDVQRVTWSADGVVAVVELAETVVVDGREVVTPEALVFDVEDDRIRRLRIFIQRVEPA